MGRLQTEIAPMQGAGSADGGTGLCPSTYCVRRIKISEIFELKVQRTFR